MSQQEIRTLVEATQEHSDPFISQAIRNTAGAIVEDGAKVTSDQKVLIWFDPPGIELARQMQLRCQAIGAEVQFFMRDFEGDAEKITTLDEDGIVEMFAEEKELMDWSDNVLIVRGPENPEAMSSAPTNKAKIYLETYSNVHERRIDGTVAWTLFLWPTEYEAEKEDLPYREYFEEVMKACDQPWEAIKQTQFILKEKLDQGKVLELHANEKNPDPDKQTHLTMSIEGMTFINSTIESNYPGSEVYSAPELYSVNGQIYAEGQYLEDGHLMKNIFLKIENGKIVEAHAEKGNDGLQELLNRDNDEEGFGSRFFGEIALGTNPGLKRRFFNPLLNEKVGGSFHMAIGHCYTDKTADGAPVNVNNGNTDKKTSLHWDLTILMNEASGGGRVVLDEETIQQDGIFSDPQLAILNPKFES